jgi:tetratricopeptide (TPR) repeat protein
MGEYKKAAELCEKNLESEGGWEMQATLYDTLALMEADRGKDDSALYYHQQALNVVPEHVDKNDPLLASYHNNVAISCSLVNQDKEAIEHYRMSIDFELRASEPDYTNIAYSYDSMGSILHYVFSKYDEALHCYKKALDLMLVSLPSTHPDIYSLYDNMADIYETQNKMDSVLDMLKKCINVKQRSVECSPHDLARTYRRLAHVYKKQNKVEEAAEMLNKCREIEASSPPSQI